MTGILLVSVAFVAAIIGVGGLLLYDANQARARTWREAAKAVGMTEVVEDKTFLGFAKDLRGHVGDLRVRIQSYGSGRFRNGTRVLIAGLGHASWESPSQVPLPDLISPEPPPFELRAEGVGSTFAKAVGHRELEIGHEQFDKVAYIRGSRPAVLAILDAETRDLLMETLRGEVGPDEAPPADALKARVEVVDGVLRADFPEPLDGPAVWDVPEAVSRLTALAQRLRRPDDISSRLARNIKSDPVSGVRLANLLALVERHPEESVTREALRSACQDADGEVRLRAALALGDEARDVLLKTALDPVNRPVSLFPGDAADSRAVRAIKALGVSLAAAEAGEILRRSVDGARSNAARAVIDVLDRIGPGDMVSPLCKALDSHDDDVACAAARALGLAGGKAAEKALTAALEREAPLVRRAVATALGRCGSAAAVRPLRAVDGSHHLGAAARQAIAEIQSRLTGATPGQLALADGDAGQLSLAEEGQEGQVSLAEQAEPEGEPAGETQWPTDGQPHQDTLGSADSDECSGDATPRPPTRRETD